jgi:hypothetical protein
MAQKKKNVKGKIVYLELEGGIWGLVDDKGKEWMPVNLHAELMQEGLQVEMEIRMVEDFFSGGMWGSPVEVIAYKILR